MIYLHQFSLSQCERQHVPVSVVHDGAGPCEAVHPEPDHATDASCPRHVERIVLDGVRGKEQGVLRNVDHLSWLELDGPDLPWGEPGEGRVTGPGVHMHEERDSTYQGPFHGLAVQLQSFNQPLGGGLTGHAMSFECLKAMGPGKLIIQTLDPTKVQHHTE